MSLQLDQNGIQSNFGAKDLIILPKCDPKDIDSYVILERLMILEEKMKRMENEWSQREYCKCYCAYRTA